MRYYGKLFYCFMVVLATSCYIAPLLYCGEPKSKGGNISEARVAINLLIVRELRNCTDMLALQEQMPSERYAEHAIFRNFKRWLTIPNTYDKYLSQYGITLKSAEQWASLLMSDHAEAISSLHPEIMTDFPFFGDQIKERHGLMFMVCLMDHCYYNRGWNTVLKENIKEIQYEKLLALLGPAKGETKDAEKTLESIEQKLPENLGKFATRRASVTVLLQQRLNTLSRSSNFPEETVLKLLKSSKYQYSTIRWLILSGKPVPSRILTVIGDIVVDDALDFGLRAEALRAFGLLGNDRSIFEKLSNQLRETPQISSSKSNEHFFHAFIQSRIMFDLRSIRDSERASYLAHELYSNTEFCRGRIRHVMPIAKVFFPVEFTDIVLQNLKREKGKIRPDRYQTALSHLTKELIKREQFTDDLAASLIDNLGKLPARKLRPIIDAIGATRDFDCFGLPMIKCYKKFSGVRNQNTVAIKNGIALQFMRMDTWIIDSLLKLKSEPDYQEYKNTIDDIISRIRNFRRKWDKIKNNKKEV